MKTSKGRVLVKPAKYNRTSAGGVIIPEYANSNVYGEIVADSATSATTVKGETVIYEKIDGREVEINGEVFHVLREEDILVYL